jgi:hypothetical protein
VSRGPAHGVAGPAGASTDEEILKNVVRSTFKFRFDRELVAFLARALEEGTIRRVRELAVARFGLKRAPSKSAIGRLARRLRPVYPSRRRRTRKR